RVTAKTYHAYIVEATVSSRAAVTEIAPSVLRERHRRHGRGLRAQDPRPEGGNREPGCFRLRRFRLGESAFRPGRHDDAPHVSLFQRFQCGAATLPEEQ